MLRPRYKTLSTAASRWRASWKQKGKKRRRRERRRIWRRKSGRSRREKEQEEEEPKEKEEKEIPKEGRGRYSGERNTKKICWSAFAARCPHRCFNFYYSKLMH